MYRSVQEQQASVVVESEHQNLFHNFACTSPGPVDLIWQNLERIDDEKWMRSSTANLLPKIVKARRSHPECTRKIKILSNFHSWGLNISRLPWIPFKPKTWYSSHWRRFSNGALGTYGTNAWTSRNSRKSRKSRLSSLYFQEIFQISSCHQENVIAAALVTVELNQRVNRSDPIKKSWISDSISNEHEHQNHVKHMSQISNKLPTLPKTRQNFGGRIWTIDCEVQTSKFRRVTTDNVNSVVKWTNSVSKIADPCHKSSV